MKKLIIVAALFVLAGATTSCSKVVMKQNSPVYSLTNSQVTNGLLVTELNTDNGTRLTGTVSGKFKISGKIKGNEHKYVMDNNYSIMPRGIDAAKRAALYNALHGSGYDIMLAPVYNVETHKRKFNVSVTGIGAKIKDVHQKDIVDYKDVIYNLETNGIGTRSRK